MINKLIQFKFNELTNCSIEDTILDVTVTLCALFNRSKRLLLIIKPDSNTLHFQFKNLRQIILFSYFFQEKFLIILLSVNTINIIRYPNRSFLIFSSNKIFITISLTFEDNYHIISLFA